MGFYEFFEYIEKNLAGWKSFKNRIHEYLIEKNEEAEPKEKKSSYLLEQQEKGIIEGFVEKFYHKASETVTKAYRHSASAWEEKIEEKGLLETWAEELENIVFDQLVGPHKQIKRFLSNNNYKID